MAIEQLRKLHQARPFQPFIIHLADGREYSVPHNEFLSTSPSGRTVIVSLPDDTFEIIDLLLVTGLEVQSRSRSRRKS